MTLFLYWKDITWSCLSFPQLPHLRQLHYSTAYRRQTTTLEMPPNVKPETCQSRWQPWLHHGRRWKSLWCIQGSWSAHLSPNWTKIDANEFIQCYCMSYVVCSSTRGVSIKTKSQVVRWCEYHADVPYPWQPSAYYILEQKRWTASKVRLIYNLYTGLSQSRNSFILLVFWY